MSALETMYKVAPFFKFTSANVQLPDVMYKAPTYIDQGQHSKVSEELQGLKWRQEKLLQDLDALIKKVSGAAQESKAVKQIAAPKVVAQPKQQGTCDIVEDVVVHADPSCPPHSIKYFYPLLKQKFNVAVKVHCHSSLIQPFSVDSTFKSEVCDRNKQKLIITIIWKAVPDGLLVFTSPSQTIPLKGEGNLARLLGRFLGVYASGPETLSTTTTTDFCLDACDVIMSPVTRAQEKTVALEGLNTVLGKQQWFGGTKPSMADAVTHSALASCEKIGKYKNLKLWYQNGQKFLE